MSTIKPLHKLGQELQTRGIGSYFQNPETLVVSSQNPALPSSICFWVANDSGTWFIGTYLPAIYEVPLDANIADVCDAVLNSSETAIYTINPELVKRFHLTRISDDQLKEFGF
jgi:hypothetical protein